jgi:hypothetical protein
LGRPGAGGGGFVRKGLSRLEVSIDKSTKAADGLKSIRGFFIHLLPERMQMARPVPDRTTAAFIRKNTFAVIGASIRPKGNPVPSNARTVFPQRWVCQGPQIKQVKRWRRCAGGCCTVSQGSRITKMSDPFVAFEGGRLLTLSADVEN